MFDNLGAPPAPSQGNLQSKNGYSNCAIAPEMTYNNKFNTALGTLIILIIIRIIRMQSFELQNITVNIVIKSQNLRGHWHALCRSSRLFMSGIRI